MLLRDGTETADPRLTRIPWFDPKSWEYKVRDLLTADEPLRSRHWRCGTYLNQGNEGACTGFAVAHELLARPVEVKVDATFARESLYWEAQKIDPFPGGAYPGAEPFMEGSTVLAAMKVAKKSQLGPVVIGVPWYEGMFQPAACGCVHPTGDKTGGHAVCLKGIKVRRKTVVLHNSWGKGWGKHGTAELHWDDLAWLLKRGGEACIPIKRSAQPA
jgi:hypothetical protein